LHFYNLYRYLLERRLLVLVWLITLVVMLLPASVESMLLYSRSDIAAGQVWRLLTGHLVHQNLFHWLLNSGGLMLVIWVAPVWLGQCRGAVIAVGLALLISLGLWLLVPQLEYYNGLSAVLYGLFVVALAVSPYYSLTIRVAGVILVVAKLIADALGWFSDQAVASLIGNAVAHEAHLLGLFGAAIYGLIVWTFRSWSSWVKKA
jgi:rhomboid family GlyGly-CTERM serine protease